MKLWPFRRSRKPVGRIAFSQSPVNGAWGGSNQFVLQMERVLIRWGFEVCYDLKGQVDAILLIDPRKSASKPLGLDEVRDYKQRNPEVRVLHRVNECDQRKGTDFMDDLLAQANELADYTVFISSWLRDYHAARWFDRERPHGVIYNGADPAVFYPARGGLQARDVLRLVTHHWSPHVLKGFDVYQRLDEQIAAGEIMDVELWVIGRWPDEIQWRAARTFGPDEGEGLANKLRSCDAYITASRWEPCGMHHVEGIECGLPVLFHRDGGGIVEAAERCGVGFTDDLATAIAEVRSRLVELRRKALGAGLSGERMCLEYAEVVRRLVFDN
jgi:glycosyltransferase involved in cell wall biosynthesis